MRHILAALAIALGLCCAAQAQGIPDPLPVPAGFSTQETAQLNQRRAALVAEDSAIGAEVSRHDGECGMIDAENRSLVQRCEARQAQILARIDAYRRAVEAYNNDVRALAQRPTASVSRQAAISVPMGQAKGNVKVSNGGVPVSAPAGQAVRFDKVETGPRSSFTFNLPNGAVFVVGSSATLVLDPVERSGELWRKGEDIVLKLNKATRGTFRSVRNKVLNSKVVARERYRIHRAPVAVSVRGTDFIFDIDPVGGSKWHLLEGELELSSAKSPTPVILKPGQQVVVGSDGRVGAVTPVDPAQVAQTWEQSLSGP